MRRPETIGDRIAQARREMGVRLRRDVFAAEVAEAVGVTASNYSRWEANERVPREDALERLAAVFGVTPAFLRYGIQPGDFREGHGEIVAGRGAPVVRKPGKQA